jgi:hypothetical protein
MEILKKYQEQYTEFVKIDAFNLEDRARRVPAEKHFWVCRLIDAKIERERLFKKKATTRHAAQKKLLEDAPVSLNKVTMDDVDKSPSMEAINEKIKEYDYIVEYLDRVVGQITYIAQDIKNIVDLQKLEMQ